MKNITESTSPDIKSFLKLTRSAKQEIPATTPKTFNIEDYEGTKIKCVKCGKLCIKDGFSSSTYVPSELYAYDTAFGLYCYECYDAMMTGQDNYEISVECFSTCCEDSNRINMAISDGDQEGLQEIAELIQAWNKAKKDNRFVWSSRVEEMEQKFITNAKKVGLEVDPAIFNSYINEAINKKKIIYVLSTFDGDEYLYDDFWEAVDAAENQFCTEANSIYPYYLENNGTYTEMVPDGAEGCFCWTDEEGVIEESCSHKAKNKLTENKDTIYSFDLDAYNDNTDKMYTDKNNLSSYDVEDGYPYQFKGTYDAVVKKLNSIVKRNYDILMLFVTNESTGEDVLGIDDCFLLYNKMVPANTPFLSKIILKDDIKKPMTEAVSRNSIRNSFASDFKLYENLWNENRKLPTALK